MKKNVSKQPEPKIRPKEPNWDFSGLESVIRVWAKG